MTTRNSDDPDHTEHAAPGADAPAPPSDPYKGPAIGTALLFALILPAMIVLTVFAQPEPPEPAPHPWAAQAVAMGVEPARISQGQHVFRTTCALCHGQDAQGIVRLGKPLRNSAYVQEHTNDELFSLISTGRLPTNPENTTGVVMPARGNQNLSDEQLESVIVYLRAIQDPFQPTVSLDDWIVETVDADSGEQMAGLVGVSQGLGHDLFISSCSACHGPSGQGMEGLGKPLASSEFVASKTDQELMNFIKSGRPMWDAENTTGVDMPPKGGNPALTDEQLADIVKYIRALHKQSASG